MRAVILAGGRGTRMAPFTKVLPKPLIPLGDYPILEIILCQLRDAGFTHITLALNYLAQLFRAYFGNGERLGIDLDYSVEREPLGTGGPLSLIDGLDEPFLVMNADVLTDLGFDELYDFHVATDAALSLALHPEEMQVDFGVVDLDARGRVTGFGEKPRHVHNLNMGVYVLSPAVLDLLPRERFVDMPDLVRCAMGARMPVHGYLHRGKWLDLGRTTDFNQASEEYQDLARAAESRVALESLFPREAVVMAE